MATTEDTKKAARVERPVRWFKSPEITLMRMGREVAAFRGDLGRFDVKAARLELSHAMATVGGADLTAATITIDLERTALTASGGVRLAERGVMLEGDRVTALPSLARMRFAGSVRLKANDRASADALLGARLF